MNESSLLHSDRLFPVEPQIRELARALYQRVANLPLISPHGHTDPAWFATNAPFKDPASLFIIPDHYLLRMFYSQGIPLEIFYKEQPRIIWRLFCKYYYLFRGTPSRFWLDHAIYEVFKVDKPIQENNADYIFDHISQCLTQPEFLPRALFEKFNIEVLATTESPTDLLLQHQKIQQSGWSGRVITTFRPDPVVDPDYENFLINIQQLGDITKQDVGNYQGYLAALRDRRHYFKKFGATATDHGHPSARTVNLAPLEAAALYERVLLQRNSAQEAELFRAQMLTEMAKMSLDDGLVMQIHPGSFRNHNSMLFKRYGRDKGADIPMPTDYVHALKPLLDLVGNEKNLTIIIFTLDESTYSRELAPLIGHYSVLKLGPPWWFLDSVDGIRRYLRTVTETTGFYNLAGFNDDTRGFVSIPARHDMSRRIEAGFLAELVCEHRLTEAEAHELIVDLAGAFAKKSYKL